MQNLCDPGKYELDKLKYDRFVFDEKNRKMKIILSRKGFDSGYGGYASPIMPDDRLLSLPIPLNDDVVYSDLFVDNDNSYFHLMSKLKSKIKSDKQSINLYEKSKCHLDPDLRESIFKKKRPKGWKPSFGQIGAAQTHLANQGVTIGEKPPGSRLNNEH